MCVSIDEFTRSGRQCRRCPSTGHSRAAAAARRQENRVTMRMVSANVRSEMGPAAAAAVASLAPSLLSNLMVSLEAVEPGVSTKLLRSPSGALRRVPGMHNDVFTEFRENSNPASARLNRGKHDPRAVSRVQLASALCERDLVLDGALMSGAATIELIEGLDRAGPFGAGAPAPRFALPDLAIRHARRIGESHLKLTLSGDGPATLDAIAFGAFDTDLGPRLEAHGGARFHLAGRLEINEWNGRRRVQLRLDDAAPAAPR